MWRGRDSPKFVAATLAIGVAAGIGLAGCASDDTPSDEQPAPASAELVMVPSLQGFDVANAVDVLCTAGFNVEVTQSVETGLETSSVVGESAPRAGSESQAGATIVLQVFSRSAGEVSLSAPDGCTAKVVEVIPQPGGPTYGSGDDAP